jgi:hypothetical protein
MSYIYLTFNDLSNEVQQELYSIAEESIDINEVKYMCYENGRDFASIMAERVQKELTKRSMQGKIVFNF